MEWHKAKSDHETKNSIKAYLARLNLPNLVFISFCLIFQLVNHSTPSEASSSIKVTAQSEKKRFKTWNIHSTQIFFKSNFWEKFQVFQVKCSDMNKRALCAFDCKIPWYFGTDSLTHKWKQAVSSLQTNVRVVSTKMAAKTDHYLEVIKTLSSMSTTEQLLHL